MWLIGASNQIGEEAFRLMLLMVGFKRAPIGKCYNLYVRLNKMIEYLCAKWYTATLQYVKPKATDSLKN